MTNDTKKDNSKVTCECEKDKGLMIYRVEKDGKLECGLSIDERGYVFLYKGSDEKPLVSLNIGTERTLKNVGGSGQYQYVRNFVKLNLDGVLDVYDKISNSDFTTYDDTGNKQLEGKEKEKIGKLMLAFIDNYVLNAPESQEVLREYMQQKKNERLGKIVRSNWGKTH